MKKYEFTLIASGLDPRADDFESRFFDAGCDDATVSFQKGHILVDFAREADSLEDAIASAVENARQAGATVDRIEPDPLVSLADMASRAEMSRAAMSNYFGGLRGTDFPAPKARVTTDSPLWDWADTSRWLFRNSRIPRSVAVDAMIVSEANDAIDCGTGDFRADLHQRVGRRMPDYA